MVNKTLSYILTLFLIIEGIVFTFGLPPFQKFDEVSHFTRTIALSQGQLFCKNRHFIIPQVYNNLTTDYSFTQVLLENQKFPLSNINLNRQWLIGDLKNLVDINGCWQNFLGYIPNTIGVWATNWTMRPDLIFYSGRIFGFLFLLLMLRISLKIINPKFGYLLWFYTLLPLVVHQATSYSYDVVIVSLILPLTALWINYLISPRFDKHNRYSAILIVLIISIIKPVYLPLLFLFGIKDNTVKFKFKEIFLATAIALISTAIGRIGKGDGNYPTFVNPSLQLQLILHDLTYFIHVVITTWVNKFIPHLDELISVFGWRNTPVLGNYLNYLFIIFAFIVINRLYIDLKNKLKTIHIIEMFFIIIMVTFLTTLAMYLAWSPVGDASVEGIQGRYWLPLVPCWLLLISAIFSKFLQHKIFRYIIISTVLLLAVTNISFSLWDRYFNWPGESISLSTGPSIIDLPTTFIATTTIGKNISSLTLNLDNRGKSIILPYQYFIMDSRCLYEFTRGYLNPWRIQGETQLKIEFNPIKVDSSGQLCLKISPVTFATSDYRDRLTIHN